MMMTVLVGHRFIGVECRKASADDGIDRRMRIFQFGDEDGDAALRETAGETDTAAAGNQYVHTIDRVGAVAAEFVEGHLFRQIESRHLMRLGIRPRFKNDKTTTLAGMAGNGTKILAGNCAFHERDLRYGDVAEW